jgi:hypothetical protein
VLAESANAPTARSQGHLRQTWFPMGLSRFRTCHANLHRPNCNLSWDSGHGKQASGDCLNHDQRTLPSYRDAAGYPESRIIDTPKQPTQSPTIGSNMNIGTWLFTFLHGKQIGIDAGGNRYFTDRRPGRGRLRVRRWVVYPRTSGSFVGSGRMASLAALHH